MMQHTSSDVGMKRLTRFWKAVAFKTSVGIADCHESING